MAIPQQTRRFYPLFAISPTPIDADSSRDKEVILSLKAFHDNHIDDDDATFLAQKGYFYPIDFNELEIMLSTFTTLCSVYFGPHSIITQGMQSWVLHAKQNHLCYISQCTDFQLFGTKILYLIDVNLQNHLHLIKQPHVPLCSISPMYITTTFPQLQAQIVGRQLVVNLPHELVDERSRTLNPKRPRKSYDDYPKSTKATRNDEHRPDSSRPSYARPEPEQRQRPYSSSNKPQPDPSDTVTNPRINPKWRIPQSQNFYDTFHRNREQNKPPMHNNTPFCVQFFVCGHCKRGTSCKFLHTDPRDLQLESAFDEYCAKAYATRS